MLHQFKRGILISLLALATTGLSAQNFSDSFDANLANWSASGAWNWDDNGKADGLGSVAWDNRSRLRSGSEGGAALFSATANAGRLSSPVLSPDGSPGLYVSFYQYFRNQGGQIRLQVVDTGGGPVYDEQIVSNLASDGETSAGNFQIIDLSYLKTNGLNNFQIVFTVQGNIGFWLLDDVKVSSTRPAWPTFPIYLGQELTNFGVPFNVDSLATPFVPFEVVVDFAPTATPTIRAAIRDAFAPLTVESCVCNRLEVWSMGGGVFFDPDSGQPLGDPGDILERVLGNNSGSGTDAGEVDNIEFNIYTYDELVNNPDAAAQPLAAGDFPFLPSAPADVVKVAILDTGFDIDHPGLRDYLYKSEDAAGDGIDADENCLIDDLIGWNFVDNNNNPFDDHSHGTHVGGIVAQTVGNCADCTVQLIPYKTHDNHGVGTLFATACATLQASVLDGADVINASWGFYGTGSQILKRAIDTAGVYGTILVAAVGNDSLNLIADDQFPATYVSGNVLSVASFEGTSELDIDLAAYSNYNPNFADIAYFGSNISSTVPNNTTGVKSGTSMATPALSGAAALRICQQGSTTPGAIKSFLISNGYKYPVELGDFVLQGTVLDLDDVCDPVDNGGVGRPAPYEACLCSKDEPNVVSVTADDPVGSYDIRVLTSAGAELNRATGVQLEPNAAYQISLGTEVAGTYLVILKNEFETRVLRLNYKP